MARSDPRKLRDDAAKAFRKGDYKKALSGYLALEKMEPQEGGWPQRAAEMYDRLGVTEKEIGALVRASERFAKAGFLLKAIAVCKRILTLDPDHTHSQQTLATLYAERGIPARAAAAEGAAELSTRGQPDARVPGPPSPPGVTIEAGAAELGKAPGVEEGPEPPAASEPLHLDPGTPLDKLSLANVIPAAAQPTQLSEEFADGITEIPLDTTSSPHQEGESSGLELDGDADPNTWADQTRETAEDELEMPPSTPLAAVEVAKDQLEMPPSTPLAAVGNAEVARDTLPRTPLFSALDETHLRRLIENVQLVILDEGDELFRQGDPGEALYVVAEGAIMLSADEEVRKLLSVLREGDFFGEISLVTDQPHNATARALVDTTILSIDRALVAELIKDEPAVLKVLLRFLRSRLIHRLVMTSPLFAPLKRQERSALARLFRFLEVTAGKHLIRQNKQSYALFALLAGDVEVVRSDEAGDQSLAKLRVGDVFGEMSLLTGDPAIASVVTRSKSWVLALPRDEVQELLENNPRIQAKIAEIAEERQRDNEISLRRSLGVDRSLDLA
jgi:CRP-like cAMP-binding protein